MSRGKVTRELTRDDAAYYFGETRGRLMEQMRPQELWEKVANMYQLAGALLIGADIKDRRNGRNANGWTDDEIDNAVEVILNFFSCPAEVTKYQIDKANRPFVVLEPLGSPGTEMREDILGFLANYRNDLQRAGGDATSKAIADNVTNLIDQLTKMGWE